MSATGSDDAEPHIARIRVFPIKSLNGMDIESARLVPGAGALSSDREYAVVDEDGEYVNGKRTAAVHRIDATYDRPDDGDSVHVRLDAPGDDPAQEFVLPEDTAAIETWFSSYYGFPVSLQRDDDGGFPDDTAIPGPTLISTGTIETVASWFPELTPESVRRRFRANVEVGGVPAFWEDRLYADEGAVVPFQVGDVELEGVNPCQRCVVPTRDPDTGESLDGFRERFVERRRETLPPWLDSDRFDHPYRLMVNTRVPQPGQGRPLLVGDDVSVADPRPA